MLGEIESNMKKTFRIKCFKLVLGVSLCFLIYLLVSLIIPPLIGTHEKSDTQAEVSITTSERVCLIDNNEDALLWRLRLIRSAQEEIILSTFDFRADSSGTDVIAALWGAAERGVQVRLIIDGINAQLHLSGSDVFQALAAHDNVEVKFYNPIRLTQLWTVNYRCHDKYLIIDRSTYLMGGRNTSDLFLGSGGTSRQNIDRDIVVYNGGFTTASANTLLEYFDRIWLLDTNRAFHAEAENHRVKKATAILARRWTEINDAKQLTAINWETETLQTNEVALLSGDCTAWNKEPMLLNTLTTLMQKGEQNIVLQTPYMICNQAMYNALKKVTDNVQVQVITNAPQSGANPWGCADYLNHRDDILETGVDICEWNGSFSMHTKTILIDDRISIIGSFNWDMRSAYLDTEMMLLIHNKASQSIKSKGWLPNLFRGIVTKAKDFLQNLIREKDMPPKPTLDIDMAEFRHMRNLMIKVQDKAKEIKNLQDKVLPHLKQQLADTKGLFKGKERKALEVKIKETEVEIADRLDKIPDTLKADGYPDVQIFMRTFREMESVVEQYNRDLAEWEYQVSRKPTAATKEQHRPPERQSVLKHLREIQERNKQQPPQRQYKKSIDRDSR